MDHAFGSATGTKLTHAAHGSAAPGWTSGSTIMGPNIEGSGSAKPLKIGDPEPLRQSSVKANGRPQTETPKSLFNDAAFLNLDYEPQNLPDKPSELLSRDRVQHDLGHLMYHRQLEDFGMQLQKAAEATMITDRKSNYACVSVLLLHWENESFDIIQRVYDLGHLLSKHYDFDVERWAIPISKKSHREVYRKMYGLVEDDNQMHLRIVFYTGPACLSEQGELIWMARGGDSRQSRPSRVRWPAIQSLLEEAPVDVLILLDCCRTATSSFDGGNGVTSLIAACSFNTVACRMSQNSFIEVLIRQLKIMRSLPSFSSAYLYSRIYQDIQSQPKPADYAPRELPVHLVLSQDPAYPRDILLSANHHKDTFRRGRRSDQASVSSDECLSRCPTPTRKGPWDDADDAGRLPMPQKASSPRHPRLLLSFRLLENMDPEALRVDLFSHWLGSLPIPVDSVKVEAGFSSDSTVLLVSVPVAMLPFLPRDPSVTVIGTIHSSNLLVRPKPDSTAVEKQPLEFKYYHLPLLYMENPHQPDVVPNKQSLETYQMNRTPTVARVQLSSWDVQCARSVCAGRLPHQSSNVLEGCEVSMDGRKVVFWSKTKLMVFASGLHYTTNDHTFIMTGQFQLNPEFERSWVNVKIGANYLIASTSATFFNCYIFDLNAGKNTCADLGVWDRVDLSWPKVHKVAISPDEKTVAFVSGLNGVESSVEGSQVFSFPTETLIRMNKSSYSNPGSCISWNFPTDEVEQLTLNDLGDGYVVIRSKSADNRTAHAAVVYYSLVKLGRNCGILPSTRQKLQPSDQVTILPVVPSHETRLTIAQNRRLSTELLHGRITTSRIAFSRSSFVDQHLLGVVGHYGSAVLTVETKESEFGYRTNLLAYQGESQTDSWHVELAELLPPLDKNSVLALAITDENLLVLAATIGQFRFAVYKIRLPRSLLAKTLPLPIEQEGHADAFYVPGPSESNEQTRTILPTVSYRSSSPEEERNPFRNQPEKSFANRASSSGYPGIADFLRRAK